MSKKLITAALSLLLTCALAFSASAASLSDLEPGVWYYDEVTEMVDAGIINGYPDGSFKGEETVTLAEYVTIAARYKGLPTGAADGHWAGVQMELARTRGWIGPEDAGEGDYDMPVSRQLAAKITVKALGLELSWENLQQPPFTDMGDVGNSYSYFVRAMYTRGIYGGYPDGSLRPMEAITRGMAATIIYRAANHTLPYTSQEIGDFFASVALGSEYGDSTPVVKKWAAPIYYYIKGNPTQEDESLLTELIAEMNAVSGFPGLSPVRNEIEANLVISFCGQAEMNADPNRAENWGYASLWWYTSSYQIYRGEIYYLTEGTTQQERNTFIAEELIQAMGMLKDTYDYPESIFYQYYTEATWPSGLDWTVFTMLYSPEMKPGMNEAQCRQVISALAG